MTNTIYALIDPRDGRVRYVGKTSFGIEHRLMQHIQDAKRRPGEIARYRWINLLAALNLKPSVVTLEECGDDWQERERYWIAHYRNTRCLLNATDGGDGIAGHRMSEETKRKMSAAATRRASQPDEVVRLADMRERAKTVEALAKLSASLKATYSDPALRERLSRISREIGARPEVRAARSAKLKGRVFTQEWMEKISVALSGKTASAETRAKQSAARTGKRHSQETIEKMRVSAVLREQRKREAAAST